VPLTLPIRDVVPATPRARIVRLDLGDRSFEYAPGQAVVVCAHGADKARPYSLAAAPEDARRDRALELLVGVEGDGAPGPPFTLEAGARVDVDGPVGAFTFPDSPADDRFLFIAGGTGIAPLRAMLRHALTIPHRTIGLFYSARTPDDFAYEAELRAVAAAGRIELRQTVTRAGAVDWSGARGRIDREALGALLHDASTLCFICGPPALVDEMPRLLAELGIAAGRIKIEEW
jgi:ferredoxin-NADP reductase